MKKTLVIISMIVTALVTVSTSASAQLLIGGGANVNALSTSNFTTLAQIGTFTMLPQAVAFNATASSIANGALVGGYGRLTFDGTNFFVGPQSFQWSNLSSNSSGFVWITTNQTFPVYAAISITNGMNQAVTNLTATH